MSRSLIPLHLPPARDFPSRQTPIPWPPQGTARGGKVPAARHHGKARWNLSGCYKRVVLPQITFQAEIQERIDLNKSGMGLLLHV